MGVYLGSANGIDFWSMALSGGRKIAVSFDCEAAADVAMLTLQRDFDPEEFSYVEVAIDSDQEQHASITDLRTAGLSWALGQMNAPQIR